MFDAPVVIGALGDTDLLEIRQQVQPVEPLDHRGVIDCRARRAGDGRFGLNNTDRDAGTGKLQCGHQTHGPGTHDQHAVQILEHPKSLPHL